jgi:hypothetical protein
MMAWNYKYQDGVCSVCLGGAVLVGRGLVEPGHGLNGPATSALAYAINDIRVGIMETAYREFNNYLEYKGLPRMRESFNKKDAHAIDKIADKIRQEIDSCTATRRWRANWTTYLKLANALERAGA